MSDGNSGLRNRSGTLGECWMLRSEEDRGLGDNTAWNTLWAICGFTAEKESQETEKNYPYAFQYSSLA